MRVSLTAIVVGCTLSWPLVLQAGEGVSGLQPPFDIGERLTFEISWLSIAAATAVLEVVGTEEQKDRTLAKLVGTAQSRPVLTRFFPVDNRVESEIDFNTLVPEHMTFRRREGRKK